MTNFTLFRYNERERLNRLANIGSAIISEKKIKLRHQLKVIHVLRIVLKMIF